ncbi:YlaH-like family protein [Brevibacillus laterosporus]|uniref:YlaH-like family protein n=1 Tax=Brevibacillus laterosporus TaxID=1465 RepID=UPI0026520681|nr:YlaH-like family protein [Brevibacillus laterosporus]MDN9012226.1 YlaH-like family protein [Brevibacillus laterosporus]MDO0943322.1 YlaH-like family protein [Brevibacillus laterosporus]
MELLELASIYDPANPEVLTWYDHFFMWADLQRYWIIFVYLLLVYYLGFAEKIRMPILKTALLIILLLLGSVIFAILDTQLPVRGGLFVAIIILTIVKLRTRTKGTRDTEAKS